MVEILEPFRIRLEKALKYREMKPSELAKATGISEATISQYRSGYSKPKDDRLVRIANALRVNPSWLMGLDVPMKSTLTLSLEKMMPDDYVSQGSITLQDVSDDDLEIFQLLRSYPPEKKAALLQMMKTLLK